MAKRPVIIVWRIIKKYIIIFHMATILLLETSMSSFINEIYEERLARPASEIRGESSIKRSMSETRNQCEIIVAALCPAYYMAAPAIKMQSELSIKLRCDWCSTEWRGGGTIDSAVATLICGVGRPARRQFISHALCCLN
jgi:hypothetical protein